MNKEIFLNYNFSKFLNADYNQHTGSCVKHQVHELNDIHEKYGGFPASYKMENTIIHQLWWNETEVDFLEIGNQLNIEVITISSIKQPPGCVVPWHRDTFFKIKEKYPNEKRRMVRANIFLEDRKIGHYIEHVSGVCFKWKKGQGFIWDSSIEHLGANAGMEPKYTLQVSGFYLE